MKSILLILVILSSLNCSKEKSLPYNLDDEFLIEGIVNDSFGNPLSQVRVNFINVYYSEWLSSLQFHKVKTSSTNDNGYYKILFKKNEIVDLIGDDFRLDYERFFTISEVYYREENDNLKIDLKDFKLVKNKILKSGGYVKIIKQDDSNISYTESTNSSIIVEINQKDYSFWASEKMNQTDIIVQGLTVIDELPFTINWRIQKNSGTIYHSESDTFSLKAGEEMIYYMKY